MVEAELWVASAQHEDLNNGLEPSIAPRRWSRRRPRARGADLVDGMVGMSLSAIGVRAGVAVIRSQNEMLGTILDMRA